MLPERAPATGRGLPGRPAALVPTGDRTIRAGRRRRNRAGTILDIMDSTFATLVGGPTLLLEIGGVRLLTDPTFDPPGSHAVGSRELIKTEGPAVTADDLGRIDAVLLSHDQHPDNLDRLGRAVLERVPTVLSTPVAADRLAGTTRGLQPWQQETVAGPDDGTVSVTAVPARHGPPGAESAAGPVTGFWLTTPTGPRIYVSGDNASLEIVREIRDRMGRPDMAVLFAGAARTALLDGAYLTLTSQDAVAAARILGAERVCVVHTDGWAHFSQNGATVRDAFDRASLADRLVRLEPGVAQRITVSGRAAPGPDAGAADGVRTR